MANWIIGFGVVVFFVTWFLLRTTRIGESAAAIIMFIGGMTAAITTMVTYVAPLRFH